MGLETYSYAFKYAGDNNKRSIGLMAQDVQKVYPELVTYAKEEDQYLMNYSGLGVVAIKATQELKKEVDNLKAENAQMKKELAEIKALLKGK